MSNKIKDIFSDDMFNINGNLHFRDEEAYKNFLAALEIVQAEGRVVPIDGVTSITTEVGHLGAKFPLAEHTNISHLVVGPAIEPVRIPLRIGTDEKIVTLLRSQAKNKVVLRSESNSIVSFTFTFLIIERKHTLNYKVQFDKAKSIKDVVDSFNIAAALLSYMYKNDEHQSEREDKVSISDIKNYFRFYSAFFGRLLEIEGTLGLSILPSLLNSLSQNEQRDIDELYLLLIQRRVVRLNSKLSFSEPASIIESKKAPSSLVGSSIVLTFPGTIDFSFLQHTVRLYTANLIANAIVKEMQEEDGVTKIFYGDTDSKPMYISFSAFRTEEEAQAECAKIVDHKDIYLNALTSNAFIEQFYTEQ